MKTETKTWRIEPDTTVVAILGRLNLGNLLMTIENSIQRLVDQGVRKLVIDLSELHFIDSSGIGMLVTSSGYMEQHGGRMRIAGAQGSVGKALELVHISRLAPMDADVDAACRSLASDGAGV